MRTMRCFAGVLGVALIAATLGACFQHTFTVGAGAPQGAEVYRSWHHHWLFGLIRPKSQKNVELARLCPSGNATIYEKTSFLNGLVGALIGYIYSPTTVTILCGDGTTQEIELSADEVTRIVHDPLFLEVVAESIPERYAEVREIFRVRSMAAAGELPAGP